ncbi:phosphoribosyltransferase family protein [Butyrivibrio sp. AE3006]|uniref:phosphoribosyltransferase family protein n=1 Tax=Butyrivibrio sp. AE3006 TaxID=1280673 RepID=UPI00040F11B6|nr:phosphoribosyltransferase [Butyrivibrio sp. AE3006]
MRIKVIEKRRKEVEEDCQKWADEIEKEFVPDIVVFVADSGFLFGKAIAYAMDKPLYYVKAKRAGDKIKNKSNAIKKMIPMPIVKVIISSPLKFYLHGKNHERNLIIPERLSELQDKNVRKILLVDDAVDTGWSIKCAYDGLNKLFKGAEIKVAGYTVCDYSMKTFKTDYYRFFNKLVITATSRKSDEYNDFLNDLRVWNEEHG